jgi:pilus assembly protein CpaF
LEQALRADAVARLRRAQAPFDTAAEERILRIVGAGLFGLGGLEPLLTAPDIANISVNRFDHVIVQYADGRRELHPEPVTSSNEALTELVRQIAAHSGSEERRFDRAVPRLNAQLDDGSRLFAVMSATGETSLSIRRHHLRHAELSVLGELGMFGQDLNDLLRGAVKARLNILVSGGTNGGKTTLLTALARETGPMERLVTIEDTMELNLHLNGYHQDVLPLVEREANIEGQGAISQAEMVRWALRMNPDRVIVGEIRGPEVVALCNVMSQGNDGSMSTIHSSTSRGVFTKLAAYAAQGPERLNLESTNLLVASAVHLVVQLARTADGTRVVSSVREITGADGSLIVSNEIWEPGPDRRAVKAAPLRWETQAAIDEALAHAGP